MWVGIRQPKSTVKVTPQNQPGEPSLLPLLNVTWWLAWPLLVLAMDAVAWSCRCRWPDSWLLPPQLPEWRLPVRWVAEPMIWCPGVSRCSWLAHDLCRSYPRGWKSKNLATLTAIMEVALFPTMTYVVGDSSNTGKSSDAGRLQFGHTSSSHFIKGIPLSLSFSFLLTSFFFFLLKHLLQFCISSRRRKDKEITFKIILLYSFLEVSVSNTQMECHTDSPPSSLEISQPHP